ncbi:MAG: immunoglobulin domain-containing protein, partial [Planctomycetes bacterium]|nr:immunoglobulin domain-containing protein [Planctomycetota bacterium]
NSNLATSIWDTASCSHLCTGDGHSDLKYASAFSPGGSRFVGVCGAPTNRAIIWNTSGCGTACSFSPAAGSGGDIRAVAWCPDPDYDVIVTGSGDNGVIMVWNAQSCASLHSMHENHGAWVHSLAFFPGSRQFLSAGNDGTVRMWSADGTSQLGPPLVAHNGLPVYAVAISPDGSLFATAGADNVARLWLTASWPPPAPAPLREFGHSGPVNCVAFSRDGRLLATGSDDWTARVWPALEDCDGDGIPDHQDQLDYPEFILQPASQTSCAGGDADFFVQAQGAPPLDYQWTKDDVVLVDDGRIVGSNTPHLRIDPMRPSDAGDYRISVGNVCGAMSSSIARLTVICITADLNCDRTVDLTDLATLLARFGTASGATLADGDLDGDGDVDLIDRTMLLGNFGAMCP